MSSPDVSAGRRWARVAAVWLGTYALLGGAISLAGYAFDLQRLTSWDNNGISIQPNATVAVMTAAASIVLLANGWRHVAAVLGAFVALIGGSVLFQYVSGTDLQIDTLLMFDRSWGRLGVTSPGRMGPLGATCWTVLGLGIVLAAQRAARARRVGAVAAMTAGSIAGLSLIGYVYGATQLYAVANVTVVALQTATFILAVSLGLLMCMPDRAPTRLIISPGPAGVLVRRILPAVIVMPIAFALLRLAGEAAGFYDSAVRTAIGSLLEMGLLLALLFWTARAVQRQANEREAVEEELHEQQRLLTIATEGARVGLVIVGPDHRCLYANQAYRDITVSGNAEIVGQHIADVLPEAYESDVRPRLEQAFAGERVQYELALPARDRVVSVTYQPQFDVAAVTSVIVTVVDISERRRVVEALRQADRRKDEFLATLAHELRNPLAPIRTAVELLRLKGRPDPEVAWAQGVIRRQVELMVRLLDDLLDIGRIASDKLELRTTRVDVAAVLRDALETCHPLVDAFQHQLTVTLPSAPIHVQADPVRLGQVFGNLLINACRYTEPKGQIWVGLERQEDEAAVVVRDSGVGIPPDQLTTIFDMFAQVNRSLERSQSGLGVGLYIVKRLVEMHGGTIEARSEGPGSGSTFIVRLEALPAAIEPAAPARELETDPLVIAPRRVLVVDDNVDAAASLAMLLGMTGNEVHTAHDGVEGLELAERVRPDVVLLDIGMPGMNGYDVCRQIRALPWGGETVMIAVTGWGQDGDRQLSRAAGFDHHMVKPVEYAALLTYLASTAAPQAS